MAMSSKSVTIHRVHEQHVSDGSDLVSVEEPLEIRLMQGGNAQPISITMRTPGHDAELAVGFFFTEGIVRKKADVIALSQPDNNIVVVELNASQPIAQATLARNFYTTSSCGVCGKASIDAVSVKYAAIESNIQVDAKTLWQLPTLARASQTNFAETGGSHASSLFTMEGNLLLTREDVGRHNALDKVIGHCLLHEINMRNTILLVCGRASFELIQKAAVAGIPVVAAIGAPSSLAVELANESGISLIGFLKAQRFNIYSHPNRIKT